MTSIEFRAPWSRHLRIATTVSVAVLLLVAIVAAMQSAHAPLYGTLLLTVVPLLLVAAAFAGRVRGYVLTERAITVQRGAWNTTLPLAGLRSVTGDVGAMHGSIRVFANGGLFSFTGGFWNRKLGYYRALATDPSRAVVLCYAKRKVVISPHDPQHFIMRSRTLIKAAEFR